MSVDGKEHWLENRAIELFEEIQRKNPHLSWKEIDIDDELEKRYEKFHEWLDTCPFKWTESSHPTSGMTCVNFEIEEE